MNDGRADDPRADRFEKMTFTGQDGGTLGYRYLKPAKTEEGTRYPLVIFLHGAGERGDDNTAQLVHGVKRFSAEDYLEKYPCFVVAPQCPTEKIWASTHWTDPNAALKEEPSPPTKRLMELIDSLETKLPIDKDREYLTGLSMGGYGTWDMAQRQPKRFAAIVPVCGGADIKQMERIKHLPIWIFHGAKDQAVKVERSREAVVALEAVGAKPNYTEYPEVGHDSWNNAYADEKLYEWLFAQKRAAK